MMEVDMALGDIDEDTFVAFTDISGFKKYLINNSERAEYILKNFYSEGYQILKTCDRIKGLFISDCGILIVKNCGNDYANSLKYLLESIRKLNSVMLGSNITLTTSIAFGRFVYLERSEFPGIEKNLLYGPAYLSSYLDNEKGKPKIQPGQCRIVIENLPMDITNLLENINTNIDNRIFGLIRKRLQDERHYYFYWMRREPDEIDDFEKHYMDSYELKYDGFLNALKGNRY
jgi:hypothetical protein